MEYELFFSNSCQQISLNNSVLLNYLITKIAICAYRRKKIVASDVTTRLLSFTLLSQTRLI